MSDDKKVLFKVRNLRQWFPVKRWFFEKKAYVKAVDDVSFDVYEGETLGIAGESGCGKSTLIRSMLRIIEPTSGELTYNGQDFRKLRGYTLRKTRCDMQVVFQDPYSSLDPYYTVGKIIREPLDINQIGQPRERDDRVKDLMNAVGLDPSYMNRFPHEFSGGQRQRIVIARALATTPRMLMCDEAVSALDVSVRAQILNLLEELQEERKLTYIFVSHDLSVLEHICNRIIIMYLGKIVEIGDKRDIFSNPKHPYTIALLSAAPSVDDDFDKEEILLEGDIPSPVDPPSGCRFHTRCPYANDLCKKDPPIVDFGNGHLVACHYCNSKTN
jgi:oligopeptide/dipeptide ABC transporter ATP-binding protein